MSQHEQLGAMGFTGSTRDREKAWLKSRVVSPMSDNVADLYMEFFDGEGIAEGSIDDRMKAWLQTLAPHAPRNVSDLKKAAFADIGFYAPLKRSIVPVFGPAATFARATTATVRDHEGKVRPALSGEVRFQGARRVRNFVPESLAIGSWDTTGEGGGEPEVFDGVSDPLGGSSAYTLRKLGGGTFAGIYYGSSPAGIQGRSVLNSIWIRRRTGTGTINFRTPDNTDVDVTSLVTTEWQRICGAVTTIPANDIYIVVTLATEGDEVDLWHPQQEDVTGQSVQTPAEYVSNGVLAAPYHGANVDGVKYFDTLNGNVMQQNMLVRSDEFDAASWTKYQSTATANQIIENTSDAGAHQVSQNVSKDSRRMTFTYAVEMKSLGDRWGRLYVDDGTVNGVYAEFDLTDGVVLTQPQENGSGWEGISASIERADDGFYRCSMTFKSDANANLLCWIAVLDASDPGNLAYLGDGSSGLYVRHAQLQPGVRAGTYVATAAAAVNNNIVEEGRGNLLDVDGYLAEGARTNGLVHSENIFDAQWGKSKCSVDANTVGTKAPDWTNTADELIEDNTNGVHTIVGSQTLVARNADGCFSFFVKRGSGTRNVALQITAGAGDYNYTVFDLTSITASPGPAGGATHAASGIEDWGNGWYRCWVAGKVNAGDATLGYTCILYILNDVAANTYVGDGTSSLYLWGGMHEAGAFASSYIPTTTAAVTRNADNLTYPYAHSGAGALAVEFVSARESDFGVLSMNVTNSSHRVDVRSSGATTITTAGAEQAACNGGTPVVGELNKIALSWAANDARISTNGGAINSDTSVTTPTTTTLQVGNLDGALDNSLGSTLKNLRIWTSGLPDATLVAMTA